ncbi:hypothetical protein RirG_255710 [Rhizophagus irregularis DAOM 197198w]|uniref:DUF6570 domain-containing protein n=1 Tax=Rhizophagus irregularis (strain DAOM 197198w) TaxID=1432141 RepID=A0A015JB54_RHIIW|nr:hypothetical protein RirG_255710 [Rhizophagus irregularis DAOM 197198w]
MNKLEHKICLVCNEHFPSINLILGMCCRCYIYYLHGGQYAYSGNVINFLQDIGEFVSHLSRHLSTLDTLIIRRSSAESSTSFRDFTVHRDKVRKALCWLKRNNRYYANIIIDDNVLCTLPDEGSIDYLLSQVRDAENRLHHVDYKLHDADRLDSETDDALAHMQSESGSVMWPNIDDTAINEFNMPGYIARAFPTLYPTGSADL